MTASRFIISAIVTRLETSGQAIRIMNDIATGHAKHHAIGEITLSMAPSAISKRYELLAIWRM